MRELTRDDLPDFYPIYFTLFPREGKVSIARETDANVAAAAATALAKFLDIPEEPYSTSLDACDRLLNALVQEDKYTQVLYRHYRENGTTTHIICDVNDDTDYTDFTGYGSGLTRAEALFKAIVSGIMSRMEALRDD